ncbi:MAG TPA: Gfo/Idh/MocA family oxidoreductase [bacterium]|nr:Gfo/Idh/MocA family oxidoreductase [bacterium]
MSSEEIRIGIVGAGGIVRSRHIPGLKKIPGVRLIGVANRTLESSGRAAKEFGIEKVFPSWEELVRSDEIDAVLIGTWPYMHCPVTLAALDAGKHVFCQARMCMNYEEAVRMTEAARRSDRVTMLCPPPVGMVGDYRMRDLLDSGRIGEIRSIHLRAMSNQLVDPNVPFHWRQDRDLSGYNTLTVGIYAEVIHRWFGQASRIAAVTRIFTERRKTADGKETREVRIPDAVFVSAEMASGALANLQWSGVAPFPEPNLMEAHGSRGTLRYMLDTDEIYCGCVGDEKMQRVPIPPDRVRHWTVEQDFIDAIREGKPVSPSFEDGLEYMEFTEAVIRSGEQKCSIDLPLAR